MTIRNSREFVGHVRCHVLDEDVIMVYFEVVSLFTNDLTPLAVRVAETRLRNDDTLPSRTSFTVEDIVILLLFCLQQSPFTFRERICHHYRKLSNG